MLGERSERLTIRLLGHVVGRELLDSGKRYPKLGGRFALAKAARDFQNRRIQTADALRVQQWSSIDPEHVGHRECAGPIAR